MTGALAVSSDRYPMAALIRFTLIALYLAMVAPLPLLAPAELKLLLWLALPLGLGLVVAATSEAVELSADGIRVGHPSWCAWLLRRGWSLPWQSINGLTPVATSQGGRVFYVRGEDGSAYLLPQRVAAFEQFLGRFSQETGINTSSIGRISPPWTYKLLAGLSAAMLLGELVWALKPMS
ncbi:MULTISPECIES: hypothetical protein [unclassified Cyanobium]|uniref:hypothetical protein n=1 Tax=unclassified Cyanobium TaxID=2627006 RepID=UPI0020CC7F88|nr:MULTISPECIES: hypothetical protein [unclassified Cyanobium]